MRILVSLLVFLGVVVSTGCQGNSIDTGMPSKITNIPATLPLSTVQPGSPTQGNVTPENFDRSPTRLPERVPPTEIGATTPATSEVPSDLLDAMVADLVKHAGVAPDEIDVIQAQAVVWSDGSLGCAKPGEIYTQAPVNGYRVILAAGDQKYDYRAADTGYFFLCENGLYPRPAPGTPSS